MKIKDNSLILVPLYNEEKSLKHLIPQLKIINKNGVVFINDGSKDNTKDIIEKHRYSIINIDSNQGKGNAISAGTHYALKQKNTWIITIDGDLQHPPEMIPEFDDDGKIEIKLGWRKNKDTMPIFRKFSNVVTSLLLSIRSNTLIKDSQCGYRGFPANIYIKCKNREPGFHMESEFLIKASLLGVSIKHVEIPTIYNDSESSMNYFPDLIKFISLWFKSFLWT